MAGSQLLTLCASLPDALCAITHVCRMLKSHSAAPCWQVIVGGVVPLLMRALPNTTCGCQSIIPVTGWPTSFRLKICHQTPLRKRGGAAKKCWCKRIGGRPDKRYEGDAAPDARDKMDAIGAKALGAERDLREGAREQQDIFASCGVSSFSRCRETHYKP